MQQRENRGSLLRNYMGDVEGNEDDDMHRNRNKFYDRPREEQVEEEVDVNLDAFDCSLQEWLAQDMTRKEIGKRFKQFLSTYQRDGRAVHADRIRDMCARNSASLEVCVSVWS
jgi:hypothetical protein